MINNPTFIDAMNASFRAVDSSVIVDGTAFSADNILNLNPYFTGSLLSAIMRCCSIEIQYDEEIDAATATALRGKKVSSVCLGAKSRMLGDKLSSQFVQSGQSLCLQNTQQFNTAINISVDDEYLLTVRDENGGDLASDVQSYTVPANTLFSLILKRADGEEIELTEAANIVFDMDYSYIDYGSYTVYSADFSEENNSVTLTCYDKMLDAAVAYDIEISSDTTVREYLKAICSRLGWTLADAPFTNENAVITAAAANSYLPTVSTDEDETDEDIDESIQVETAESSYTFRDVLDDIAEVIGGGLIFKADGLLYPVYPKIAEYNGETLTLSVDNQESIIFDDQYGPINSVAIIDKATGDAATLSDSDSITANGECRINIVDNPLLNANRPAFINGIFSRLSGLYYVAYDFNSYGFGYLEYADIFNIEDKKGNLKRGILLSDSVQFGLTVSETASAKAYSADSDTQYSIATPLDKIKVEVQKLTKTSNVLSERVQEATNAIGLTTDGHAALVDLELDSSTGKYYVGSGVADTLIVSEYPAVATEDELEDWTTGRVLKINYDGIAVSTTGIGGIYSDFAVYYDKERQKYLVNADDITVGNLKGIGITFDSGSIADWIVENDNGDKQIRQSTVVADNNSSTGYYQYDFILKNDKNKSGNKKAIYSNRYEYDPENETISEDSKKEMFYITRDGTLYTVNDLLIGDNLYISGKAEIYEKLWAPKIETSELDIPQNILWSGAWYMNELQTIELTEKVSDQTNGIVLVFSRYSDNEAKDEQFKEFFVPKTIVAEKPGKGHCFDMASDKFTAVCSKYLYISDTTITGREGNADTGTASTGITYNNKYFVLRYVIGV